jgi:hypothetical protein
MRDHHQLSSLKPTGDYAALKLFGVSLVIAGVWSFAPVRESSADGKPGYDQNRPSRPTTRQYDTRLPPVMPGEEIVTETGQKMKVWSSAGPVPVNPRPTPQQLPTGANGAGIGVIVDTRDRYDHGTHDHQPLGRPAGR